MIPTTQTVLYNPAEGLSGNCLSAVLASLLHMRLKHIPVFNDPITWRHDLNDWLLPYSLAYIEFAELPTALEHWGIKNCYHTVSGNSGRLADVCHAVVGLDNEVIWDPHPSRNGLIQIVSSGIFISLRPWLTAEAAKRII